MVIVKNQNSLFTSPVGRNDDKEMDNYAITFKCALKN